MMKALVTGTSLIPLLLAGAACLLITGHPTLGPNEGDPWHPSGFRRMEQVNANYNPQWTPDGASIVFSTGILNETWEWDLRETEEDERIAVHGGAIYMASLDGQELSRVSLTPLEERRTGRGETDASPQVSPGGTRVVYITARHTARDEDEYPALAGYVRFFELETAALDGTGHARLTATQDADSSPVWSPDGSRIAYIHHDMERPEFSDGFPSPSLDTIKTMAADGSDVRIVFPRESHRDSVSFETLSIRGGLTWLADGQRLGFRIHDGFYTVQADGSGLALVHPLQRDRPERRISGPAAWSSGGEWVAFARRTTDPGVKYIWLWVSDRQGERKLYEFQPEDRIEEVTNIEWFPGDEALLVSAVAHTPGLELTGRVFVISRDGDLAASLEGKGNYASVSPDGSLIALSGGYGQWPGGVSGGIFYRHAPEADSLIYLAVANSDGSGYRPLVIANLSEDGES